MEPLAQPSAKKVLMSDHKFKRGEKCSTGQKQPSWHTKKHFSDDSNFQNKHTSVKILAVQENYKQKAIPSVSKVALDGKQTDRQTEYQGNWNFGGSAREPRVSLKFKTSGGKKNRQKNRQKLPHPRRAAKRTQVPSNEAITGIDWCLHPSPPPSPLFFIGLLNCKCCLKGCCQARPSVSSNNHENRNFVGTPAIILHLPAPWALIWNFLDGQILLPAPDSSPSWVWHHQMAQ